MLVSEINSAYRVSQQNFNSSLVVTNFTFEPVKQNEITNNSKNDFSFSILKKKLTNEEYFQKLYEPDSLKTPEDKYIAKLLSNPAVVQKLFQDKDIIKASTLALLKVTEKQFNTAFANNDRDKLKQLALVYGVLSIGLDSLKQSQKSNANHNKNPDNSLSQVAFAGLFNYGFFEDNITNREKAEAIVNRWSTSATCTAALLANTGIGDKIALTYITKEMCKRVFKAYQVKGGYVAALTGVATGAVIGTQTAATALTIWPGAGNAANATITYGLHQMTGRACIAFCEDCGNLSITSDADAIAHFGVRMKNFVNVIKNDKIRELATAAIDKALDIVF